MQTSPKFSRVPRNGKAIIETPPHRMSPYKIPCNTVVKQKKEKPFEGIPPFNDEITIIGKKLRSFSYINFPPTIKSINIKKNLVNSFEGLPNLKELESLDISENPIDSFISFPNLPNLKSISYKNTPLCNQRNSQLAFLILVGPSLKIINGELVQPSDRAMIKNFPEETKTLLEYGWKMTSVPPKKDEITKILNELTHLHPENRRGMTKRTTNKQ